jgi:hypothetical protein
VPNLFAPCERDVDQADQDRYLDEGPTTPERACPEVTPKVATALTDRDPTISPDTHHPALAPTP